jgi:hypothetical protein
MNRKLFPKVYAALNFCFFCFKKKRYNQNLSGSNHQFLFYIILIVPIKKRLNSNENRISAWNFIFLKFKLLWQAYENRVEKNMLHNYSNTQKFQ